MIEAYLFFKLLLIQPWYITIAPIIGLGIVLWYKNVDKEKEVS